MDHSGIFTTDSPLYTKYKECDPETVGGRIFSRRTPAKRCASLVTTIYDSHLEGVGVVAPRKVHTLKRNVRL